MTLGELKAQFKGLLNNSVVNKNDALVTTFINQSLTRIQRELRVPFMEKLDTITIPDGYTSLAIPADLLELIALMVDTDDDGILEYALTRTDLTRVVSESQQPGMTPRVFTRQGTNWILGPKPGAGSQVLIYYYCAFDALTDDSSTNTCLINAWDAVMYGALSAAADFLNDDRTAVFEGRYQQIIKSLQEEADAQALTSDAVMAPALHLDTDDCW